MKRAIDMVIALGTLIISSPIILATMIIIYIRMGRPIFFAHDRVGFDGRTFRCYKFRTMVVDAEKRLEEYLAANPAAAQMWRDQQKLKEDPRVTPIGRLLRQSSVDELPQLYNVLRGDMSCIGPRPITLGELKERFGRRARYYTQVRPGITGLWQVSGRSNVSYRDRILLDCAYVRKWSLLLDLKILAKTLPAILKFRDTA